MTTARKKTVKEENPDVKQDIPSTSAPLSSPIGEDPKPQQEAAPTQPEPAPNVVNPEPPSPQPMQQPSEQAAQSPQQPTVEGPQTTDPLADFKSRLQNESFSNVPPKKNFMWPIIFIFILALLMLGGIFLYKQQSSSTDKTEKTAMVSVAPSPTETATPTPEEVDLTKYEIEVLNGSEVAGEAGKQQSNLEDEGFTVSSVGNAESSDYEETVIQAKKDVDKAFISKLRDTLESSFVVAKDTEALDEDSDSDVVVILGSKTN